MWMLFVILMETNRYFVSPQGPYPTAELCELARDAVLQTAPQPKINYDAICIQTDHDIGS
jgi:hypothetical protein